MDTKKVVINVSFGDHQQCTAKAFRNGCCISEIQDPQIQSKVFC